MIRGTTPTLYFKFPFDCELLAEAWVSFVQNGTVVLDKALTDCQRSNNTLTINLSQRETLKLQCDCLTQIQIRCKTKDGTALASQIICERTDRILKDGVI